MKYKLRKGQCPDCREEFNKLGNHWQWNPEHRPELTEEQKEVITGLLMGDGSIVNRDNNGYFVVEMIKKEFLEYLTEIFPIIGKGVKKVSTAEEKAKARIMRGDENVNISNHNDIYMFSTCTLPDFKQFSDWYEGGEKEWPDDIDLTPTILKYWYVSDGTYARPESDASYISISAVKEKDNANKITNYFEQKGFNISYFNRSSGNFNIIFDPDTTSEIFEYMGKPLPGFEYKWPNVEMIDNAEKPEEKSLFDY